MNILEIIHDNPDAVLLVKAVDLHLFSRQLIASIKQQGELGDQGTKQLEPLLTTAEVQEVLKISDTTLWRMNKEGTLVPVVVGGTNRYKVSDIERIINQKIK